MGRAVDRATSQLLRAELREARERIASLEAELLRTRQAAVTLASWSAAAMTAQAQGRAA